MPHHALVGQDRPELRPEGSARRRVMVLHGEIEGVLPTQRHTVEYGGALVGLRELGVEEWTYIALGHYHVQHEVAPHTWYSGSLEYVGTNIWGELADEAEQGIRGKGWLLADLDRGLSREAFKVYCSMPALKFGDPDDDDNDDETESWEQAGI